jgi:hypothetical protein
LPVLGVAGGALDATLLTGFVTGAFAGGSYEAAWQLFSTGDIYDPEAVLGAGAIGGLGGAAFAGIGYGIRLGVRAMATWRLQSLTNAANRTATAHTQALSGPVRFRPPAGATAEEIAQIRAYCQGCNQALAEGALSPTGRVSTAGELRAAASRAAAQERAAAAAAGRPYAGHAGHIPDTTWTGQGNPWGWMDLTPRVNMSLGGQAARYPIGWRPTEFHFEWP